MPEEVAWRLAILAVLASAASANGEIHPKERKRLEVLARGMFNGYPSQAADNWLARIEQTSVTLEDCSAVVRQLTDEDRQCLIFNILSVLYADGQLDEVELGWLQQLIQLSGTNPELWIQCLWFFERPDLGPHRIEALSLLGLTAECTDTEIKTAYRRACMEYHPDRLVSLSAPIQRLAEEKLQQVNAAYEFLQSGGEEPALSVMASSRQIKAVSEVTEREVVFCPLCETRNRLPIRQHHHTSRCATCSALLAVPPELVADRCPAAA